jgi:hypothetical protein
MSAKRINFSTWGHKNGLRLAGYAIDTDGLGRAEAVAQSIARTTGLRWCGGLRSEGTSIPDGADHYAGTLGRPCRDGGYTPVTEIWFAISPGGR